MAETLNIFEHIFNSCSEGIVITDKKGKILLFNTAASHFFEEIAEHIRYDSIFNYIDKKYLKIFNSVDPNIDIFQKYSAPVSHYDFINRSGKQMHLELNSNFIYLSEEHKVLVSIKDITRYKLIEHKLKNVERRNQSFLSAIPDLMFRLNKEGVFLDYIANKNDSLYTSPQLFLGKNIVDVLPTDISKMIMHYTRKALATGDIQVCEYELNINGSNSYFEARIFQSDEEEAMSLVRDVTKKKQIEFQLKYLSMHDSTTGLYNRTFFEEKMKLLDKRNYINIGLIVCDINGLKLVNDTMGHPAGDKLLKKVAELLKYSFKENSVIARIGGDEFAILIPQCSESTIKKCKERVLKRIDEFNKKNPDLPISVSIGSSIKDDANKLMHMVYTEADNSMYQEKFSTRKASRNSIIHGIIKALEKRDFQSDNHTQKLETYVTAVANSLNLPKENVARLKLLAKFHDIGKIGVSENILFKSGSLTTKERNDIETHSEIGYRIALSIHDIAHISDLILKHHEWWDGNGYPLKLSGNNIPIECRIFSIADAYDAMINNRPYKEKFGTRKAKQELKSKSGTQFDPDIVKIFLETLSD